MRNEDLHIETMEQMCSGLHFVNAILEGDRHPNVCAVERHPGAILIRIFANYGSVTSAQLHRIRVPRDPDVRSVEGYAIGQTSNRERAQTLAVAGSELADRAVASVGDPHIGAIKGDARRGVSHSKRPQHLAIARP